MDVSLAELKALYQRKLREIESLEAEELALADRHRAIQERKRFLAESNTEATSNSVRFTSIGVGNSPIIQPRPRIYDVINRCKDYIISNKLESVTMEELIEKALNLPVTLEIRNKVSGRIYGDAKSAKGIFEKISRGKFSLKDKSYLVDTINTKDTDIEDI